MKNSKQIHQHVFLEPVRGHPHCERRKSVHLRNAGEDRRGTEQSRHCRPDCERRGEERRGGERRGEERRGEERRGEERREEERSGEDTSSK